MPGPKDRGRKAVASPCISVCALDAAGRICIGCFRTVDEIRRWPAASDAERRAIRAVAEARSRAAAPPRGRSS